MSALSIIGLLVLLVVCVYATFIAVACCVAEMCFTGASAMSGFLVAVATVLWVLLFWLNPLSITVTG